MGNLGCLGFFSQHWVWHKLPGWGFIEMSLWGRTAPWGVTPRGVTSAIAGSEPSLGTRCHLSPDLCNPALLSSPTFWPSFQPSGWHTSPCCCVPMHHVPKHLLSPPATLGHAGREPWCLQSIPCTALPENIPRCCTCATRTPRDPQGEEEEEEDPPERTCRLLHFRR